MKKGSIILFVLFYLSHYSYAQNGKVFNDSALKDHRLFARATSEIQATSRSVWLGVNFGLLSEKFESNENSQSQLNIGFNVSRFTNIEDWNLDIINLNLTAGLVKRYFRANQFFFELNPQVGVGQTLDFDRTRLTPALRLGFGKGRIDRINDKMIAEFLVTTLLGQKTFESDLVYQISAFIREQKNQRTIYNLGNIEKELDALVNFLEIIGVTNNNLSADINKKLIKKYYKILPAISRTEGKTIAVHATASSNFIHFSGDKIFDLWRTFGSLGLSLNYNNQTYLNKHITIKKIASISTLWLENYNRGYGISEHALIELNYFPQVNTRYSLSAGLFNQFHTLNALLNYGLQFGGGFMKILNQRSFINFSAFSQLEFDQGVSAQFQIELNF